MCLARVELLGGQTEEARGGLTDIARIERTPEGLRLTDLVGMVTELDADIQSINFIDSTVTLDCRNRPPTTD
ncbi:MAG: CooT family nickel-binding protein [Planctomycetota bacterium]